MVAIVEIRSGQIRSDRLCRYTTLLRALTNDRSAQTKGFVAALVVPRFFMMMTQGSDHFQSFSYWLDDGGEETIFDDHTFERLNKNVGTE
jgi:hypothetical protein